MLPAEVIEKPTPLLRWHRDGGYVFLDPLFSGVVLSTFSGSLRNPLNIHHGLCNPLTIGLLPDREAPLDSPSG